MHSELSKLDIVVTGGTGALGSDIVSAILERGATAWVPTYLDPPSKSPDNVHFIGPVDLSRPDQVASFYEKLPPLWASIHVAGGFAMSGICETSFEDFEKMWRMNTVSAFLCCQASVSNMRANSGGGRIVNVAARPAVQPTGGMIAYTTSKAGVASLTQCLAKEVATEGITVNAILPSIIDTPANRKAMPDADHASWPKTAEIAHVVVELISPKNSLTSGALLPVYGKMC